MIRLGDEVAIYYTRNYGPGRGELEERPAHVGKVSKVGRRWATIENGRGRPFEVDVWTGYGRPRNGFSAGYRAVTSAIVERRALADRIYKATGSPGRWTGYATVDELRAVLAIVEPIAKRSR